MAFMTPYYSNATFVEVTNKHGESTMVEQGYEDLGDGEEITATYEGKWFCHLSANGYMDQTEWTGPFDTEDEAREYIVYIYEVDPDTGDDLDEAN
jgi:hypothetical protein